MTFNSEESLSWEPVHTRNIDIRTFEKSPGSIVVQGTLTDNRLHTTYPMSGRPPGAGIVHQLTIRMHVTGPALTIEAMEAQMSTVPLDQCRETQASLEKIRGMCIAAGFTERVKARIGGSAGCTHLTALLLAMAPAAVQGFWAAVSRKPVDPSLYGDQALAFLTDTCRVWRREGPMIARLKHQFESAEKRGANLKPG